MSRREESRSSWQTWWAYGALAWSVAVLLHLLTLTSHMRSRGLQLADWQAINATISLLTGALLSLPLLVAFRRLIPIRVHPPIRIVRYLGLSVAYWILWSLAVVAISRLGGFQRVTPPATLSGDLLEAMGSLAFNSLVIFAILAWVHEAVSQRSAVQERRLQSAALLGELARARSVALRARLRPSFLFSTLDLAGGLMERDVLAARKVLADLAELLRAALARDGDEAIPLRDEIRLAERHLAIEQQARESLSLTLAIAPGAAAVPVPPLLLPPLIGELLPDRDEPCGAIDLDIGAEVRHGSCHLRLSVRDSCARLPSARGERPAVAEALARLRALHGDLSTILPLSDEAGERGLAMVFPTGGER